MEQRDVWIVSLKSKEFISFQIVLGKGTLLFNLLQYYMNYMVENKDSAQDLKRVLPVTKEDLFIHCLHYFV